MKTKKEILKMTEKELQDYKWSSDLDIKEEKKETNSDCSDCFNCSNCRNIKTYSKFMICNVQLTEKEYRKKMKELKNEN
ncbi:MAG: hypothetical protein ABSG05_03575 [Candidatus Pacearchaeota archaeon]|jgi:hypothetical protein